MQRIMGCHLVHPVIPDKFARADAFAERTFTTGMLQSSVTLMKKYMCYSIFVNAVAPLDVQDSVSDGW